MFLEHKMSYFQNFYFSKKKKKLLKRDYLRKLIATFNPHLTQRTSSIFFAFHWLPVKFRIHLQILLIAYKWKKNYNHIDKY